MGLPSAVRRYIVRNYQQLSFMTFD